NESASRARVRPPRAMVTRQPRREKPHAPVVLSPQNVHSVRSLFQNTLCFPARIGGSLMKVAEQIEQQASQVNEGVAKVGNDVSLGIHHAILAGGEPTRKIADFLHGTWLGHPLHPVLTDFTIGAWAMGAVFDLAGGLTNSDSFRQTGDRLTTAGVVCAVPTALTGLVDFSTFPEETAKTVTWHGMLNVVNFGLFAMSVRERRRGNRGRGLIFSTIGLGLTAVSAWLGGHLVYKQQFGVNHADTFD